MSSWLALMHLARWLGPWAGEAAAPGIGRTKRSVPSGDHAVEVAIYEPPSASRGVYFVAPGLHFLGPDDARFDKFCRSLAAAGFVVVSPFVPSFLSLTLAESALGDARAAFAEAVRSSRERGLEKPAIFSISFGSSLAFDIATHPDTRDDVGGVIVFGGFYDFEATVRFAVTGETEFEGTTVRIPHDPLNAPVVYLNMIDHLDVSGDKALLASAWRTMTRRTWNRPDLKAPGMRDPYARTIAERLPAELREPFLRGCGLAAGGLAWLDAALARSVSSLAFLEIAERLRNVSTRVVLVHGRDDDVIPWVEAEKIARALPPESLAGKFVTGLYGHTTAERVSPRAIVQELRSLGGMLRAMVLAPRAGL